MSKGFASSYRIVLLASVLFVCFGGLGVRLVWLHVIDREALLKTITRVRHQLIVEQAKRGDIRDDRGAILATSHSRVVLGVDPSAVRAQDDRKFTQLAAMIGLPETELRRIVYTRFRAPVAVAATLPTPTPGLVFNLNLPPTPAPAQAAATVSLAETEPADEEIDVDPTPDEKGRVVIRWAKLCDDISEETNAAIQKLGLKCITADRVYRRAYPNNELAAHLLGYVNRQQQPAAGIEAYADFYLRGQSGWRVGERDGRNRELAQFNTRKVPPSDGYTVYLSIDTVVQDIVEQELAYLAQKYEPLKATIIVSDPRSGFILGMANTPTFNPNEYNQVPKDQMDRMKNVGVTDIYEPGSVFKIVSAAGALEEKLVSPHTLFDCGMERITYNGRTLKLPSEDHKMGELSVSEIISHSSNRGAAQLGMLLGAERLDGYARAFGFGAKLGFPVGGEVSGIFIPYKKWNPLDITRIPMGHTVSSTVLQMHQAMSVIAADGVLLRPQIIRQIRDAAGEVVYRYDRDEIGRAVSAKTARTVAQMLMGVTLKGGTAPEAAIEGFDVAGKTGTSQKLIAGQYSTRHHVASFVGFFPAARPQVAISVVVDDADRKALNGVAYGAKVAAPSFKRIGERLIPILNIQSHAQPSASPGLIAVNEGVRR